MDQFIKEYFPDDCPLCKGKITFNTESFMYICLGCGGYVSAHRQDTEYTKRYQPEGYLANKEINLLRKAASRAMKPLFMERIKIQGKYAPIDVALINALFEDYYVSLYVDEEEKLFGQVISNTNQVDLQVSLMDSGKVIEVEKDDTDTISNRDKARIWLARQLGLTYNQCQIKFLNSDQLKRAIELLNTGVLEARRKAINSS